MGKTLSGITRLFLAVLMLALIVALAPRPRNAEAIQPYPRDQCTSFKGSIASTAAIVTAQSGKIIVIKSMLLTCSSATFVTFTSGSGGTTIGNIYLEANKPFPVTPELLGGGMKTLAAGVAPYAVADGGSGTLSAQIAWNVE